MLTTLPQGSGCHTTNHTVHYWTGIVPSASNRKCRARSARSLGWRDGEMEAEIRGDGDGDGDEELGSWGWRWR